MAKTSKLSKIEEKKVKAYELLRKLGTLGNESTIIRNDLNALEQEIAALENEHT